MLEMCTYNKSDEVLSYMDIGEERLRDKAKQRLRGRLCLTLFHKKGLFAEVLCVHGFYFFPLKM